jgi:glycosyltransferase involved in cell wall biosynthesis
LEPYDIYRKVTGQKERINPTIFGESNKAGFIKKIFLWIRGNVFIPDPRILWIRPSVTFLCDYLKSNPVDVIASTGPPHSMHLIARNLKRKLDIPWLADFRDPWTQIYFFDQLRMNFFSKWMHRKLEKSVLREATSLVTVSPHCSEGLQHLCNRQVTVITNGYEEFGLLQNDNSGNKIKMLYTGVLSMDRNPHQFWIILEQFLNDSPELKSRFELWLIGNIDSSIISDLKRSSLATHVNVLPSMPHRSASILLLIGVPGHPGVITGKFFEYLFIRKPIFSISPANSDLVGILENTRAGLNAGFDDTEGLKNNLKIIFDIQHSGMFDPDNDQIELYSRKNLTGKLAGMLDQM